VAAEVTKGITVSYSEIYDRYTFVANQRDHGVLFRNKRQVYGGTSRPTGCYRENANHMLRWVTHSMMWDANIQIQALSFLVLGIWIPDYFNQ
jgi:hypothetical protein